MREVKIRVGKNTYIHTSEDFTLTIGDRTWTVNDLLETNDRPFSYRDAIEESRCGKLLDYLKSVDLTTAHREDIAQLLWGMPEVYEAAIVNTFRGVVDSNVVYFVNDILSRCTYVARRRLLNLVEPEFGINTYEGLPNVSVQASYLLFHRDHMTIDDILDTIGQTPEDDSDHIYRVLDKQVKDNRDALVLGAIARWPNNCNSIITKIIETN